LQVVGAEQHAGHDDAGVDRPVERDPAYVPIIDVQALIVAGQIADRWMATVSLAASDNRALWECDESTGRRGSIEIQARCRKELANVRSAGAD
jgi:hypothetical protein